MDFLFGLDMLKRHLCVIDLKSNHVALGSAGTTVPFLSEKDLPASMRETKVTHGISNRAAWGCHDLVLNLELIES